MQEYEDDFFFEEDKIKITNNVTSEDGKKEDDAVEAPTHVEVQTEDVVCDHRWDPERHSLAYQNLRGMTITSGNVIIVKDETNLIGISIGGGAPLCPCLYIVQVFDNTPASKEGTLQSGDELVGVNGQSVKGKTKVEVAKMIQAAKEEVSINYNKLHADPCQGKTLDIILKKVKHRLVENMSTSTADALGLSRAILCNDTLFKKLQELEYIENTYHGLMEHAKRMLKAYFDLLQTYKNIGDTFAAIGVREPQPRASEAFSQFGNYHRQIERDGIKMLKSIKPILADMGTNLNKAIPDMKLTVKKYANTKFEYLSYCLKVKEMDDEEFSYSALQEPLYRVETGNYEYRLILRCRQDARNRFAKLRSDVLVKMELLNNKHNQDIAWHLHRLITGLSTFHEELLQHLKDNSALFPVEMDLTQNAFQYKSMASLTQPENLDDDAPEEVGKEITEHYDINAFKKRRTEKTSKDDEAATVLLPDLETKEAVDADNTTETTKLLAELGLADINTSQFQTVPKETELSTSEDMFFNIDLSEVSKSKPSNDGPYAEDDIFGPFMHQMAAFGNNVPREDDSLLASLQ